MEGGSAARPPRGRTARVQARGCWCSPIWDTGHEGVHPRAVLPGVFWHGRSLPPPPATKTLSPHPYPIGRIAFPSDGEAGRLLVVGPVSVES